LLRALRARCCGLGGALTLFSSSPHLTGGRPGRGVRTLGRCWQWNRFLEGVLTERPDRLREVLTETVLPETYG
jgi:hypothetical protein